MALLNLATFSTFWVNNIQWVNLTLIQILEGMVTSHFKIFCLYLHILKLWYHKELRWFLIKNPFLFLKYLIHNHSKISKVKTKVHCQKKLKFNSEIIKILQRHLDICLGFNQKRRLIWATLLNRYDDKVTEKRPNFWKNSYYIIQLKTP